LCQWPLQNDGATCCTKSKIKTKTFAWYSHLLSLNIDTHGSNLLRNFKFNFLPKLASKKYFKICSSFLAIRTYYDNFKKKFFTVSLLRNLNSNLCSDHSNKINVLPQYAVPPILFKFSGTKANSLVILDVYDLDL
jgi:hypothetical protein